MLTIIEGDLEAILTERLSESDSSIKRPSFHGRSPLYLSRDSCVEYSSSRARSCGI